MVDSTAHHPDIITMKFHFIQTHLALVRVRFSPFPQRGDALLQLTRLWLLALRLCFWSGVQRWQLKQEQQVSISDVSPTVKTEKRLTGDKRWNKDLKHKMDDNNVPASHVSKVTVAVAGPTLPHRQ